MTSSGKPPLSFSLTIQKQTSNSRHIKSCICFKLSFCHSSSVRAFANSSICWVANKWHSHAIYFGLQAITLKTQIFVFFLINILGLGCGCIRFLIFLGWCSMPFKIDSIDYIVLENDQGCVVKDKYMNNAWSYALVLRS